MNFEKYPWINDLESDEAIEAIRKARESFVKNGAVTFPNFITDAAIKECVRDVEAVEADAFTIDDLHTPYLRPVNKDLPANSVQNFEMQTHAATVATDELPADGVLLKQIYRHPAFAKLVAKIVGKEQLYTSDDPVGSCSVNAFRPPMRHAFHFDESEFSTTLMLRESEVPGSGLFQYTDPTRKDKTELAYATTARTIAAYEETARGVKFAELEGTDEDGEVPRLHTLDFRVGTLSLFAGARSLHRVTKIEGSCSRLVAVLTFASQPGFRNSKTVRKMFWGRTGEE